MLMDSPHSGIRGGPEVSRKPSTSHLPTTTRVPMYPRVVPPSTGREWGYMGGEYRSYRGVQPKNRVAAKLTSVK